MGKDRMLDKADQRLRTLLAGKAYRMYYDEVRRSLSRAQHDLTPEHSTEEGSISDIRRLFHSLKGSSGFFGFQDIESAAGKIESILASLEPNALQALGEAQKVVNELEQLVEQLPLPAKKE